MSIARLHYAASESDADLLYLTGFHAPDPFIWWQIGKTTHAILSSLEIDRARKASRIKRIHAVNEFVAENHTSNPATLISAIAKKMRLKRWQVPRQFPVGLADILRRKGLQLEALQEPFCPSRLLKTDKEIQLLTHALRKTEAGLARGIEVLRAATIGRDKKLRWAGSILTSERLRGEIDATVMQLGALPAGTIVAGGRQGCDPHERGHGPLRANELIIMDIFPRDQSSGYFGDLTRTVVKGRATEEQKHLHQTVADGKRWIMSKMRSGADGKILHEALVQRFAQAGFPTERRKDRWVGFFHGTGHGVGLEIHEAPRFAAGKFRAGMVVTVEPGLYYPEIGGVRLEDMVVLKKNGIKNLTTSKQLLELP